MTNDDHTVPLGLSARTDRVAAWIGWHLGELAGVAAPLVLTVTMSVWFALVSGLVLAMWAAHEVRGRRQQQAVAPTTRALLPQATPTTEREGVSGESA